MSKWISIEQVLPPQDPNNQGRSVPVLICDDGAVYDMSVSSRYYDFNNETWVNEYYAGKISPDPLISYWMPIPAVTHPNWIAAKVSTPKTMDKKVDGSISDFTINVLIFDQSSGDPQKIQGSYRRSVSPK
jgi:hypothetical protein